MKLTEKIDKSFEFLFALAVPFMFGIWGVAENFVPSFFGNGYKPVVMLLYLMSPLPIGNLYQVTSWVFNI